MRSAKEILKSTFDYFKNEVSPDNLWAEWEDTVKDGTVDMVTTAMKDHAIEFAKEINKQGYREYDQSDRWINLQESNKVYTTSQLYEKFEKDNK